MHRLNAAEFTNPFPFTPAKKLGGGARIGRPRVTVANVDIEEFEEAERGFLPCTGDQYWEPRMPFEIIRSVIIFFSEIFLRRFFGFVFDASFRFPSWPVGTPLLCSGVSRLPRQLCLSTDASI